VLKNLLFLASLLALGFVFFSPARNNPFWHSNDYEYLLQALRIGGNWREIFARAPHQTFQPLVNLVFYFEFLLFGSGPMGYYAFNVVVHAVNAFLVYFLVLTLLRDRTIAIVSGVLFVLAVGNYGKAVMVVSGVSDLVITMLTLLTMIFYTRNELDERGQVWTRNFVLCLLFFALSLLSKATSFSLLGCMLAFNLFFREQTGRRLFDSNFTVIAVTALVVLAAKLAVLRSIPGAADFVVSWSVPRNVAAYLVRMVFPIQYSALVRDSGSAVRFVYQLATEIRILIFFCIISYSVFGFVFGNRVIRFFIAWTYITVAPFCFFRFPSDWLNIRYLYLVSVGFVMILASATVLGSRLLAHHRLRRFVPYTIPLFFVLLSHFVVLKLDGNYERMANSPRLDSLKEQLREALAQRR
jgi:hypothetical protein